MGWHAPTVWVRVDMSGRAGPKQPVHGSPVDVPKPSIGARHARRAALAALAAGTVILGSAPSGQAAVSSFGSDLAKPATVVEAHGPDTAFWNARIGGNFDRGKAPAGGQVTLVKVKGNVLADPDNRVHPDPQFHFQVLHPVGNRVVKVELSSGAFRLPVGGSSQVVNSFQPVNLCVHKGDFVDFNDIGGAEWAWGPYPGMPFQVFAAADDATTDVYSENDGTNVGSQWAPQQEKHDRELLLQSTLATGPDAT
ncbi:MAG: hypothetical protein QOD53_808, partial [Thermoleophilaceae bacterium]|nr:hypothetical protein [Thermoleophilaceae bacterium]